MELEIRQSLDAAFAVAVVAIFQLSYFWLKYDDKLHVGSQYRLRLLTSFCCLLDGCGIVCLFAVVIGDGLEKHAYMILDIGRGMAVSSICIQEVVAVLLLPSWSSLTIARLLKYFTGRVLRGSKTSTHPSSSSSSSPIGAPLSSGWLCLCKLPLPAWESGIWPAMDVNFYGLSLSSLTSSSLPWPLMGIFLCSSTTAGRRRTTPFSFDEFVLLVFVLLVLFVSYQLYSSVSPLPEYHRKLLFSAHSAYLSSWFKPSEIEARPKSKCR
jgi:hypothetical protein